jgi:hypothetical protein
MVTGCLHERKWNPGILFVCIVVTFVKQNGQQVVILYVESTKVLLTVQTAKISLEGG